MLNHDLHHTSIIGRVKVTNPEGIHVRPAMAITKLCVALREHAGISVLMSATGREDSFTDVASDFYLAQQGFGIAYTSLIRMAVQNHSEPTRSHLTNPLGYGSLRYEIASSSGENVLAVSQRIHLRAFSPCILALS